MKLLRRKSRTAEEKMNFPGDDSVEKFINSLD